MRKARPLDFFTEFIRHPKSMGAVAPSSPALVKRVVSLVDIPSASAVVEFGPGTGVFTEEILKRLSPDSKFFVIETSERLCAYLRERFPDLKVYADSAENVEKLLQENGLEKADVIVSGLPFASFGEDLQDRLIEATSSALRENGRFTTYGYHIGRMLPSGRRLHHRLRQSFSKVERTSTVWPNIPPAFVYRCTK